ncbi:MAG: phosphoenolpyruvate--protein phosphotransferase [Myxococcota bacterium]
MGRLTLSGAFAVSGVVCAEACIVSPRAPGPRRRIREEARAAEEARFRAAVDTSRRELLALREASGSDPQIGLILEAHALMHADPLLVDGTCEAIWNERLCAEWALHRTVHALARRLSRVEAAYVRARREDILQVGRHIERALTGHDRRDIARASGRVLVCEDLSPAETLRLDELGVVGIVSTRGTPTGHTALVARSLGIPTLVGVAGATTELHEGEMLVLDGIGGRVIADPSPAEREEAAARRSRLLAFEKRLDRDPAKDLQSADGVAVRLEVNIELPRELEVAASLGAQGVGLFRTEYLQLRGADGATEGQQLAAYEEALAKFPGPITVRTFDLGADKVEGEGARADNPALGLRGLRLSLADPERFRTQLRALLRAAIRRPLRVMFPMVATLGELRLAVQQLDLVAREEQLDEARTRLELGAMIELPSAVMQAEKLAAEVDFLSVGTNDLIQYTLGVDRNDPEVAHRASPFEPAVLRLLAVVVSAAKRGEVDLGMCGDMASHPLCLPLVLGLGFRRLSVPTASLPWVRAAVERIDVGVARVLTEAALEVDTAEEVEALTIESFQGTLGELWNEAGGPHRSGRS